MKKIVAAAVLVSACCSTPVWASSDAAWNAMYAKANGTCIGMSRLNTPEATAPVDFDDTVGKVAILLKGSLGKGKGHPVNLICLYDKRTGKASIEEYRWLGR